MGRTMKSFLWLLWVLALVPLVALGCGDQSTEKAKNNSTGDAKTVKLVIDFNDGSKKQFTIPWAQGMTVLEAMEKARGIASKPTVVYIGSGETALLTQIDGLKNEGGGGAAKNWQYRVNNVYATKSCG